MMLLSCIIPSITFASGSQVRAQFTLGQVCWSIMPSREVFLFVLKIYIASGIVWARWGSDRKAELKLVTNQLLEIISQTLEQTTQFH